MNRKNIRFVSVICFVIILIVTAAGCAAKSEPKSSKELSIEDYDNGNNRLSDIAYGDKNEGMYNSAVTADGVGESELNLSKGNSVNNEPSTAQEPPTALTGNGQPNPSSINPIIDQRKIIRNANLTVEVENFDKAYGMIEYIISGIGYVQETKISNRKHYVDSKEVLVPNGVIIIRVDAEKFNDVLKDVKGLGTILDENIKTDDVTEKFFDLESRLRLLKYEQTRLEEYLNKITDPDIIFKTESRLTDLRHEIEGLTGTLNKLGNLVKLSTITININEKTPQAQKKEGTSYWGKLSGNFIDSLAGVIEFCANFLVVLAAALPVLVFMGIIIFLTVLVYRKFFRNKIKLVSNKNKNTDA
ncbi:MAG: DUF4349 domain-containing protein [Clostridiaceae bacterium]|nr:DUF4349 domain-containing protein [Clostridiaceae bacterium]